MKNRFYNIDLLRIIAAYFVICLHINLMFLFIFPFNSVVGNIFWVSEMICMVAVNCFGLISGMVGYDKEIRVTKIFSLWLCALFYNIIAQLVFINQNNIDINIKEIVKMFTPILTQNFWYISCYFALYIFMPLLNEGIRKMTEKYYYIFVACSLMMFCVLSYVKDVFFINGGTSVIWLIILYIVGAGIIKFDIKHKIKMEQAIAIYIIFTLLNYLAYKFLNHNLIIEKQLPSMDKNRMFLFHNNPFVFISAIFFCLIFLHIEINSEKMKRMIIYLSPLILGVYMVHTSLVVILQRVTKINIVDFIKKNNTITIIIMAISLSIIIFVLSLIVEWIRKRIFKLFTKSILQSKK